MRRTPVLVAMVVAIAGCALDRAGVVDPGARLDAAPGDLDAGPREDAGPPIERDAGPPSDGAIDAPERTDGGLDGGPCVTRCDGDVVVGCSAGVETRTDCAMTGERCTLGPFGSPICSPAGCASPDPRCSEDGTALIECVSGTDTVTACPRGCESEACRPEVACTRFTAAATLASGTMRFNLCGAGHDHDHSEDWLSGPCPYAADGEDVLLRLPVDRPGRYAITVDDVGGGNRVDPVVYVREICDDRDTELGCHDDLSSSDLDSRLEVDLGAGEYFVIVDSVDNAPGSPTDCGEVEVAVTRI